MYVFELKIHLINWETRLGLYYLLVNKIMVNNMYYIFV